MVSAYFLWLGQNLGSGKLKFPLSHLRGWYHSRADLFFLVKLVYEKDLLFYSYFLSMSFSDVNIFVYGCGGYYSVYILFSVLFKPQEKMSEVLVLLNCLPDLNNTHDLIRNLPSMPVTVYSQGKVTDIKTSASSPMSENRSDMLCLHVI